MNDNVSNIQEEKQKYEKMKKQSKLIAIISAVVLLVLFLGLNEYFDPVTHPRRSLVAFAATFCAGMGLIAAIPMYFRSTHMLRQVEFYTPLMQKNNTSTQSADSYAKRKAYAEQKANVKPGKLIVYAPTVNAGGHKANIFINGSKMAELRSNEKAEFDIEKDTYVYAKFGVNPASEQLLVKPNRVTVVSLSFSSLTWKASMDVVSNQSLEEAKAHPFMLEREIPDTKEFRMRCNVCGHVFCYTMGDYRKNEDLRREAGKEQALGGMQTIFTSQLVGNMTTQRAELKKAQLVDYSRCPNCNSADIHEIPEGEVIPSKEVSATPVVSSMDELKKLKELLDMGIVTQEEFDAKKKQLLGL